MDIKNQVAQLIVQLLATTSPELGARLKQRLNKELDGLGYPRFDEKAFGYRKFADFLQEALPDAILVEYPTSFGDIKVYLKSGHPLQKPISTTTPPQRKHSPRIRNEVWQAFTNPDPLRLRFLQRDNRYVLHFLDKERGSFQEQLSKNSENFIEITYINAETQMSWMLGFLDLIKLEPGDRAPLEALISGGYSSNANATFTRALGEHGEPWRRYRTRHVCAAIEEWAKKNQVPYDDLCSEKTVISVPESTPTQASNAPLTPRQQVERMLDLLSDDEITRVAIPALLSHLLTSSRM